jgi:hypothetical protein
MRNTLSLIGLAFVLAGILGSGTAAAQQQIESDGPYVHRPAQAVFPMRVGEFRRSDLYRYDPEGKDVSGSYNLATPQGRLLITVYIYPASPVANARVRDEGKAVVKATLCGEEFSGVNQVISQNHQGVAPLEQGEGLAVAGVQPALTHRSDFRFQTEFDGEVQEIRSEAHLYCYVGGDWQVKYRVSAPVAVETRAPVEAFIRNGPWPGRSATDTVSYPGGGIPLAAD